MTDGERPSQKAEQVRNESHVTDPVDMAMALLGGFPTAAPSEGGAEEGRTTYGRGDGPGGPDPVLASPVRPRSQPAVDRSASRKVLTCPFAW
ncbi:hypothetical protein GCM10017688_17440 [Streptomyces ramulosus]